MSEKRAVKVVQVTIRFKDPIAFKEFLRANSVPLAEMMAKGDVEIVTLEGKGNEGG